MLSEKEVLQLAKALDQILETRENAWIEINNVMVFQILEQFSKQLADCLRAQTKLLVKLITGSEADVRVDEESERMSRMLFEWVKASADARPEPRPRGRDRLD